MIKILLNQIKKFTSKFSKIFKNFKKIKFSTFNLRRKKKKSIQRVDVSIQFLKNAIKRLHCRLERNFNFHRITLVEGFYSKEAISFTFEGYCIFRVDTHVFQIDVYIVFDIFYHLE